MANQNFAKTAGFHSAGHIMLMRFFETHMCNLAHLEDKQQLGPI